METLNSPDIRKVFRSYITWKVIPTVLRGKGKEFLTKSGFVHDDLLKLSHIATIEEFKNEFKIDDITLFNWDDEINSNRLIARRSVEIKREMTSNVDLGFYQKLMKSPTASNYKAWFEQIERGEALALAETVQDSGNEKLTFEDMKKLKPNQLVEIMDKNRNIIFEGVYVGTTRNKKLSKHELPVFKKTAKIYEDRIVPIENPDNYSELIYTPDLDSKKTFEIYLIRSKSKELATRKKVNISNTIGNSLKCDSCIVKGKCPKYTPASECGYKFEMDISTPDKLAGAFFNVIHIELERINRGAFFEKLNGGYLNGKLSNEMNKLSRLMQVMNELNSPSDSFTITGKGTGGTRIFEQLFGNMKSKTTKAKG